jgi:hypothetical protein
MKISWYRRPRPEQRKKFCGLSWSRIQVGMTLRCTHLRLPTGLPTGHVHTGAFEVVSPSAEKDGAHWKEDGLF